MNSILLAITAGVTLCGMSQAVAEFDPFTETPAEYNTRAQWLRDAKLGVFLHWTPSVQSGGEVSWICARTWETCPRWTRTTTWAWPRPLPGKLRREEVGEPLRGCRS